MTKFISAMAVLLAIMAQSSGAIAQMGAPVVSPTTTGEAMRQNQSAIGTQSSTSASEEAKKMADDKKKAMADKSKAEAEKAADGKK